MERSSFRLVHPFDEAAPAGHRPARHGSSGGVDRRLVVALLFAAAVILVGWQVTVRTAPPYCEKQWALHKTDRADEVGEPSAIHRRFITDCERAGLLRDARIQGSGS